jgi:sugar porter (SP) family MFS transporter
MKLKLILVSLVAAIGGFLFGFDTSVISGVMVNLKPQFGLDEFQEGWAVGSILVGCMIGALSAGKPSQIFGRKKMLLVTAVVFLLSTLGCAFASDFYFFVVFRIIAGVSVGASSMLSPLYISEIAPAKYRGKLVSFNQLATFTGQALAFVSNKFLFDYICKFNHSLGSWGCIDVWRLMLGVMVIPSGIFLFFLIFVPESPRWLVINGQRGKALKVLEKMDSRENAASALNDIIFSVEHVVISKFSDLFHGKMFKILMIGVMMAIFQQVTGINVLMYYAPKIFSLTGVPAEKAFMMTMMMGIVNLAFTIISISLIEKMGRKKLLLIGSVGMSVFMFAISIAFFTNNFRNPGMILFFVMGYLAFFALSLGPIVWVLIGEIFPNRVRSRGVAISIFLMWVANFAISYSLPILLKFIGGGFTFLIYALMCIPCFLFVWKYLIETKGKTLEQIEHDYLH